MPTSRPGEASELAARAAERHPIVVAMGGDGTVHEVAVGLLASSAALAVLPTGSGNDFATGLGLTSPAAGAAAAGAGRVRVLDVGYFAGRPFVNTVGLFLSGLVSLRAARIGRRLGRLRYVLASLRSLPFYRPQPAVWELAGELTPRDGRWLLAEIANGPQAGGGFRLAPDADYSDGRLDFCLIAPLKLGTLLRLFPAAARGGRIEHAGVMQPRAAGATVRLPEATAMHLDGEPEILLPGEYAVTLAPGCLRVLAPAGRPAGGQEEVQT
jgi:diacylglycerol kinase (ATP)